MDNTRPADRPAKGLLVGGAAADAERLAARLGPRAQVICLAADRATGDLMQSVLRLHLPDARVAVMLGDPALLVHKVSGPFDVILYAHPARTRQPERLHALLAEGGELYG